MIKSEEELRQDIKEALKNIEAQLPEHKVRTLMLVFQKHLNLNQGIILLDKIDFNVIKSLAHRELINSTFPKYVGSNSREISSDEANVLCIIEATISYLHSRDCLNKLPKFDYK